MHPCAGALRAKPGRSQKLSQDVPTLRETVKG